MESVNCHLKQVVATMATILTLSVRLLPIVAATSMARRIRRRFLVIPVALAGIFSFVASPIARADVTYVYTGNSFTSVNGNIGATLSNHISVTFSVATALAANLSCVTLQSGGSGSVLSFSMSDGVNSYSLTQNTTVQCISTSASGQITQWSILDGSVGGFPFIVSTNIPSTGNVNDVSALTTIDFASVRNNPGVWSQGPAAQSFVYVTNFKSNTISVFNASSNSLVATIPVGNNPVGVVLLPNGAFAFVANQTFPGTVSVIDTQSNSVTSSIPVGPFPTGIAITPNGRFVYVVDGTSPGAVSVIDTTTNSVVATIPEGAFPDWVAITPDGAFAYVTNTFSTPAYISVISTATNTQVATIPLGQQPAGIAITPNGAFAYVTDVLAGNVLVIDIATNTVVSTISVGVNPGRVSITRDGAFAYVSNFNSSSVSVIDTRTNKVVTTVPVGIEPLDVAFTSDGLLAYVANSDFFTGQGNVTVIDTISRTVVATLAAGKVPDGVAATPPSLQPSPGCVFSLSPPSQSIGPQGGLGSFVINAAAGCSWQLAFNASWITPFSPAVSPGGGPLRGTGSRTIVYAVAPDGGIARNGTISAGNQDFRVDQQGFASTCSFSISPSHGAFGPAGGNVTVVVKTPLGITCPWTATSNVTWLTVLSGASGSGNGSVTLHAAPNSGSALTGTATIAGQTFSVTQAAPGASACGALDVSLQTQVQRSQLTPRPWSNLYSESITVRNTSGSVIRGPLFLVLIGEPTHYGYPNDSGLMGSQLITTCFSSQGDYLLPFSGDLQPGQAAGLPLVFFTQSFTAWIRYTTKVLSGQPSR
jgi:YVTN family beta-propeller protein